MKQRLRKRGWTESIDIDVALSRWFQGRTAKPEKALLLQQPHWWRVAGRCRGCSRREVGHSSSIQLSTRLATFSQPTSSIIS